MRKRLLTLVLLAGTLICAPAAARAETLTSERNISFTSDNKLSEDRSAADMNSAVYELQPGDDITITLNLKNDNASAANWYMTNEVLQSLEETAGSGASGGAYEYELTYTDPAGARAEGRGHIAGGAGRRDPGQRLPEHPGKSADELRGGHYHREQPDGDPCGG